MKHRSPAIRMKRRMHGALPGYSQSVKPAIKNAEANSILLSNGFSPIPSGRDIESGPTGNFDEDAPRAWRYYRHYGRVRDGIQFWLAMALGEDTAIECENADVQKAANQFAEDHDLHGWLYESMRQLLVKGDCMGFAQYTNNDVIGRLRVVNPIGVITTYQDDELIRVQQGKGNKAVDLPPENCIHLKWDTPDYEDHGSSMVLPAFTHIAELEDLRMTDLTIGKRYREPFWHVTHGGERAKTYYKSSPTAQMALKDQMEYVGKGRSLITDDLVEVKGVGLGDKLPDNSKRYDRLDKAISLDLGLPYAVSDGDGPNYATAEVAFKKVQAMVGQVRKEAKKLLRWATDLWKEQEGHVEKLTFGKVEADNTVDLNVVKVLISLHRMGLCSDETLQAAMKLSPESEQDKVKKNRINLTPQQLIYLHSSEIITTDELRERLGLKKSTKPESDSEAADLAQSEAAEIIDIRSVYARALVPYPERTAYADTAEICAHLAAKKSDDPAWMGTPPDKLTDKHFKEMEEVLDAATERIDKEIVKLEKLSSQSDWQKNRIKILKGMESQLDEIGSDLKGSLNKLSQSHTQEAAYSSVEGALNDLNGKGLPQLKDGIDDALTKTFAHVDTTILEQLVDYQVSLMGEVSADLVRGIKTTVFEGALTGTDIKTLVRDLYPSIKDADSFRKAGGVVFKRARTRMELIVRTETMRVHNQSALSTYNQYGVKKVKVLGAPGYCNLCAEIVGQVYEIGSAPELPYHPRCRCTYTAVIEKEQQNAA